MSWKQLCETPAGVSVPWKVSFLPVHTALWDRFLLSPAHGCCTVTHLSQVCEVTLFRYLRTAWRFISGKNLCLLPPLNHLLLEASLKANLKCQTGNDVSLERPRSFHHHFPIKSNTWADCQVKLSPPPQKNISSFRKWIAIVKTDEKALPCVGATQTAAGVFTAVGCRVHLVFLRHP